MTSIPFIAILATNIVLLGALFQIFKWPSVLVSATSQMHELQDGEGAALKHVTDKLWPDYDYKALVCYFGKTPSCLSKIDNKDERRAQLNTEELKELTDAFSGLWENRGFSHVSNVICDATGRPVRCQVNGFATRKFKQVAKSLMPVEEKIGD